MRPLLLSRRGLVLGAAALVTAPSALAEDAAPAHAQAAAAKPRPKARPKAKAKVEDKPAAAAAAHASHPGMAPEEAMARLMEGNARYAAARALHPHADGARRLLVATAQHPFATVLACADSRVAPEIIFDQGLGDLFVARVAGNVVDDAILASLEYSVIHLGSTLIMALGHERCGAVKATADALAGKGSPADAETKIGALANLIAPAVRAVPEWSQDKVDAAISLNATRAAAEIFANSKPLRERVLAGKLRIVAARYDLDDGIVSPAKA